jgi:hypothetical protein
MMDSCAQAHYASGPISTRWPNSTPPRQFAQDFLNLPADPGQISCLQRLQDRRHLLPEPAPPAYPRARQRLGLANVRLRGQAQVG